MGWPPAVVIVVRHGARLDAADNQWHLTSPTPYDPPLTYGGWNQSRALGARIANILRVRETDDELFEDNREPRRKRRHKVIIHSSPFLRCVQTSVAISAGLAQNPGHIQQTPPSSSHAQNRASRVHSSPRMRPIIDTSPASFPPTPQPLSRNAGHGASENIRKSTIRIDAFLGEWLSPDYFEQITPPPSSIMMVAGAKADLLRREDYSYLKQSTTKNGSTHQGFPGGWGSPVVSAKRDDDAPLSSLSSLAQALPRRDRTSSLSNMGSDVTGHRARSPSHLAIQASAEHGIYQPPVPTYAISNSDPTPTGYVAHARDACVDVDYQWDSMREPQNWGNGGEYGEEWSSMHKRFRSGLQKMITWYTESDDPGKVVPKTPTTPGFGGVGGEDPGEDTDLVIILVTHGAGCNALIGALRNQPVLLDVSMSSLTMAVRKPTPVNTPASTPGATPKAHSRANSKNVSVSDQYDVKLVANTEHLRSTSSTPVVSRNPSVGGIFREAHNSYDGSYDGSSTTKPSRSIPTSGNFGSIRRAASVTTNIPKSYMASRQGSIGLWSAAAPSSEISIADEQGDDMILNFGDADTPASSPPDKEPVAKEQEVEEEEDLAPLAIGLWGSPRPQIEASRECGPKRRWTINERG